MFTSPIPGTLVFRFVLFEYSGPTHWFALVLISPGAFASDEKREEKRVGRYIIYIQPSRDRSPGVWLILWAAGSFVKQVGRRYKAPPLGFLCIFLFPA